MQYSYNRNPIGLGWDHVGSSNGPGKRTHLYGKDGYCYIEAMKRITGCNGCHFVPLGVAFSMEPQVSFFMDFFLAKLFDLWSFLCILCTVGCVIWI